MSVKQNRYNHETFLDYNLITVDEKYNYKT